MNVLKKMRREKIMMLAILCCTASASFSQNSKISKVFSDAEKQSLLMIDELNKVKAVKPELVSPRSLDSAGKLKAVASRDWTSGFFPGVLWFIYEFNKDNAWKQRAENFTANIEREKTNATTHDMGFKVYCSFGTGYMLAKDPHYKEVIIESAKTLSTRFKPVTGTIRSWDFNTDRWTYPVIIDNMMNLELLFAAARLTGDSSFHKIAVSHANATMKNHFRPDYSSYHVVDYDTVTGKVVKKITHQGYANESAWARGQMWGLYGFTMCYRFTGNKKYLEQAEKIAGYVLNHPNMPNDLVPYWDYNAPNIPNEQRDVSAAAVLASALYELSTYSKNGKLYKQKADKVMESLTNNYRAPLGTSKGFVLLHSVGSRPSNSEVDVPLSYADYYYLEAVLRAKKLKEKKRLY